MIPARLLNASLVIYVEFHGTGSAGEPTQFLRHVASLRGRGELKSVPRQSGDYQQTPYTVSVWVNGSMDLTPKNWIKITTDSGREIIGQVATASQPGLMGHHVKTTIEVRKPHVPVERTI